MICKYCGNNIDKNGKFCQNCGKELSKKLRGKKVSNNDTNNSFRRVGRIIVIIVLILFIGSILKTFIEFTINMNDDSHSSFSNFTIDYPASKSSFEINEITYEGIQTKGYNFVNGSDGDGFSYNIITNEYSVNFTDIDSINEYLSVFPENMFSAWPDPVKDYSMRINFRNKYEAVDYQFHFVSNGVKTFNKGIHFIENDESVTLSVLGVNKTEEETSNEFDLFINSFNL